MNRNDCRATRQEIDQSELGQRLSAPMEAHLANCAECAQFRAERAQLRELVGSLAPVTAPADFDMRLRARMARERSSGARQPFIFRALMSTPGIAVAAILVMLIGSLVWFNQRKGSQPANSAATAREPATSAATSPTSAKTGNTALATLTPPVNPVETGKQSTNLNQGKKPAFVPRSASKSSDFAVSQATSVRLTPDRAGEVSLTAPINPMVVSVRDEHGATRKILLPPVSFGSQRLTDNRVPVSMNNTRDW
jgi:hypothetical protein